MSVQTAPLPFKAKFPTKLTPPPKQSSAAEREYLYPHEVESLIASARHVGRHGNRDAAIILLMFRHGFRTAELVALKWSQVDLKGEVLKVLASYLTWSQHGWLNIRSFYQELQF